MSGQLTERRFAAFLRGVNVGGAHRLPMAEVRAVLGELGASDVATYIQSGNIVFTAEAGAGDDLAGDDPAGAGLTAGGGEHDGDSDTDAAAAEAWAVRIAAALEQHAGFPVPTAVRSAEALVAARQACPYAPDDPRFCHLILLESGPPAGAFEEIRALTSGTDTEVAVEGATAYLHTPGGLSATKPAAAISRRLGGTARNLRTVNAVIDRL
ncbi:DUF1697 domain-containing protein [Nocardia zapadnayensis]|nr:DUF1697 domain-containing protein [Nocardia zapadnayensis]MCX0275934.1 DUF1697 domain-containing protein [Nocardia zapadnayensis]